MTMPRWVPFVLATVAWGSTALGCPNPLRRQRMTSKIVEAAEQALGEGRYRRSYTLTDSPDSDDSALYRRALAIHLASALRRGFESWVPDNHSSGKSILKTMRTLVAEAPDDLWLRARLVEALAAKSDGEAEAREILEDLARRDLVPDPSTWGILGQLRARAGDEKGAAEAAGRCQATAKAPIVCTPLRSGAR